MRIVIVPLLSVLGYFCLPLWECRACSCDRQSVPNAYSSAEIVFEGTITSIEGTITTGAWPAGVVKFRITRIWKGNVGSDFEMPAVVEGGSCIGFYPSVLKRGNKLLVYAGLVAWTPKGDKAYFTHACARTQLLKDAKEDLAVLQATYGKSEVKPVP